MARTSRANMLNWASALLLALLVVAATAQNCYYPDGSVSTTDGPCSSDPGSACCPLNWQCLDNGLCYYPPDDYYGRYTCTDQSWASSGCPTDICTHNLTAVGAEAILQCTNQNDQYCCDGDRVHVHCCTDSDIDYFDLPDGNVYATIDSLQSPTPVASSAAASSFKSSASYLSSSTTSTAASSTNTNDNVVSVAGVSTGHPQTTTFQSVSTGSAGATTIVITSVLTPASSAAAASSVSKSSSKLPVIVGCAVGIPLFLILCALAFLLFRRRKNRSTPTLKSTSSKLEKSPKNGASAYNETDRKYPLSSTDTDMPSELGGFPVGNGTPTASMIQGKAELDTPTSSQFPSTGTSSQFPLSGTGSQFPTAQNPNPQGIYGQNYGLQGLQPDPAAAQYSPASSWGAVPAGHAPGVSPASSAAVNVPDGSPGHWGESPYPQQGGYIPYRPGHAGQAVAQNQPAELP